MSSRWRRPPPTNTWVPLEMWMAIGQHLSLRDRASLTRVCSAVYTAGSVLLYKRLILAGRQGRKCNMMLSSGEGNAEFYASLVHEVILFTFDVASRHVNLPAFAKAIQNMTGLHVLRLHVSTQNISTLLLYMNKEEHSLSSSQRFPRLAKVHLNSNPDLIALIKQRDLTEFSLTEELTLDDVLAVTQGLHGAKLAILHLHLKGNTCEDEALGFVGRACPLLQILVLQQPSMDAKVSVVSHANTFAKLTAPP
ncbi:hypothetical protein BKA70DRAFT_1432714 [Coprinopsis sp. MPI-PUGE-AT-0042]|nr:hypothetical protein BKA70DRAFT_1432714 [Coprinopsis sp. MPI-PUGE-AT-0042]